MGRTVPSWRRSGKTLQSSRGTKTKKVKPRFERLKTEMDRETEKSLNVMVVGESGLGKSTLVDTFLRPYRMKEMDRIGEKTWKVKEKEEELLVCENKVTEAKKELERLREKKEYSQCETKSKDIEVLEASMTALQEQISTLKLIDGENRAKLEALRKNIARLTRDEDEMSRNRNFTEAQKIKEQLEEKEKEKRELTKQLQTQVKREDTPDATPDAVPVLGRKTVQIEEKEN